MKNLNNPAVIGKYIGRDASGRPLFRIEWRGKKMKFRHIILALLYIPFGVIFALCKNYSK